MAEKVLSELIVQLLRRGAISQTDLAEMAYRLPQEANDLLKALFIEAGAGD